MLACTRGIASDREVSAARLLSNLVVEFVPCQLGLSGNERLPSLLFTFGALEAQSQVFLYRAFHGRPAFPCGARSAHNGLLLFLERTPIGGGNDLGSECLAIAGFCLGNSLPAALQSLPVPPHVRVAVPNDLTGDPS